MQVRCCSFRGFAAGSLRGSGGLVVAAGIEGRVAEEFAGYLGEIIDRLRSEGVRAELDTSDDRMQKKIRNAAQDKVPFQLIAGEQDRAAGTVSFRFRNGEQDNGIAVDEAVRRIREAIDTHAQV